MLDNVWVNIAVGLAVIFLGVSLAASLLTEILALILKLRARALLQGVKDIFDDPNLTGLAAELYSEGLINPRGGGQLPSRRRTDPEFIDPAQFAAAVLDIFKRTPIVYPSSPPMPAHSQARAPDPQAQVQQLKWSVEAKLPNGVNNRVRSLMFGMIERANGDEQNIRAELSRWFSTTVLRDINAAYARQWQLWTFIFALLIAASLNISAINVVKSVWWQPIEAKGITSITDQSKLPDYLKTFDMPFGWPDATDLAAEKKFGTSPDTNVIAFFARPPTTWNWGLIAGWLITALAAMPGAPFWFDVLQRLVRVKPESGKATDGAGDAAARN